ncbi:MAG: hypothetical protein MZV65_35250 [Chromatiales bacterium]|nr:hypothetical protein [Chromatiales bacterium]
MTLLERWLPAGGEVAPGRHFHPTPAAGPGGHGQQRRGRPPDYPAPAPPPAPADAPLDERALAQIRALQRPGQPSVLGKIIGLYLDGAPALLQRLREAVAAGDGEALRQAATASSRAAPTWGRRRWRPRARNWSNGVGISAWTRSPRCCGRWTATRCGCGKHWPWRWSENDWQTPRLLAHDD